MTAKRLIKLSLAIISLALFTNAYTVYASGPYPNLGKETPISVPDCSSGSDVTIVDNSEDLLTAIDDPTFNVICVEPGSYDAIKLTETGRPRTPKYLIPNHADGVALEKPWNLDPSQRVTIAGIEFKTAYWYVVGIAVTSDDALSVEFKFTSTGNVMDSVLIEGISERLASPTSSRSMARMSEMSIYNSLQNSVIQNPPRNPGQDSHCLVIRDSQYNTVINNQFIDCPGDGIQIATVNTADWDNRGNNILNNEIYITDRLHASCSDPSEDANLNGPGQCSCAENGIDVKDVTSETLTRGRDMVQVNGNIMYGFRETHSACGGTGDRTAPAIYLHNIGTQYMYIQSNLIFDVDTGIQLFDKDGLGGPENIYVYNNLFHNVRKKGALHVAGGANNEFIHNTIVLTLSDVNNRKSINLLRNADSSIVTNNLIISEFIDYPGLFNTSTGDSSTFTIGRNGFVGNASQIRNVTSLNDTLLPSEPLSNYGDYCTTLAMHTAPATACFSYMIPTAGAGTIDIISNNAFGVSYDFFFNSRGLPRDLGAFELTP